VNNLQWVKEAYSAVYGALDPPPSHDVDTWDRIWRNGEKWTTAELVAGRNPCREWTEEERRADRERL